MAATIQAGENWTAIPARRENVGLVIGLAGPTGSGKTYSALELAVGLAGGEPIALIDTENGRSRIYASEFTFNVVDFGPPYTPSRYAAAIRAQWKAGYKTVIVDQISHEWEGEGGLEDWHDRNAEEMVERAMKRDPKGNEDRIRETYNWPAWREPKVEHRQYLMTLLRAVPTGHHLILLMRAEQKTAMVKENGKNTVGPKVGPTGRDGWFPIAEKSLPYEMLLLLLMLPDRPGVPLPIKSVAEPLKPLVPLDKPLSRETGKALAAWAKGAANGMTPTASPSKSPGSPEAAEVRGATPPVRHVVEQQIVDELKRRTQDPQEVKRLCKEAFGTEAWSEIQRKASQEQVVGLERLKVLPERLL